MGLFNWVFKGVKVEKRPAKKKNDSTAAILPDEISQILAKNNAQSDSMTTEQTVTEFPSEATESAQNASSILFDQTGSTMYSNEYNANNQNNQFSTQPTFSNALNGATYGNRNILVVTPRTTAEVSQVVANIQNGDACIICLDGLEPTDAQRRLDFLSGVVCSMHGSIKKLNPSTYILTPSGIGVRD